MEAELRSLAKTTVTVRHQLLVTGPRFLHVAFRSGKRRSWSSHRQLHDRAGLLRGRLQPFIVSLASALPVRTRSFSWGAILASACLRLLPVVFLLPARGTRVLPEVLSQALPAQAPLSLADVMQPQERTGPQHGEASTRGPTPDDCLLHASGREAPGPSLELCISLQPLQEHSILNPFSEQPPVQFETVQDS